MQTSFFVFSLARRVARRQPQPRGVVEQLQVRCSGRLNDLNKSRGGIQQISFLTYETLIEYGSDLINTELFAITTFN